MRDNGPETQWGGGTHSPVLWVGRDGFVRGDFSRPASAALSKPLTGTGRVDDGGWHHVALSFGPGEQRLHVDGVLVGMGRGLGVNSEVFGGNFTLGGSEPFLPGWPGLPDGSFPDAYLSVSNFDEPALYGRVLETSEINGIFASGSRGKPTLLVNEATLPAVSSGIPYRQALSVQGATGVLTWSITSGSLPGGLSLSSSGIISGMLARIRSSAVSIQVTDNTGAVGVRDYVIAAQGTPAPVPFGAVAWWRGDLNPNDSSGSRHGVPTFSGPTYRSGNSGNAFFFNREGSSLALPAGSFPSVDTLFGSRTPYSFETWFLTDRPGVILGRRDFGYPLLPAVFKPALYVGTDGLLRAPMFEVDRTAGAPVSSQRVDDGKFHHAAVTYDGSTLRLYLDGVLQGPLVTNATSRFGSLVDTVELGSGYTGSLGFNWPATQGGWMSFYGYIDEPSTYNRALNEGEIRAINQAGEMGKANAPVINVTLPAGRIAESYLTAAFSGQGALVVFGSGGMPPGLQISPEGIVSGIPESAGLHQFKCGVRQSNGTWLTFQYSLSITGTAASPVGMAGCYSGEGTTLGHLPGETAISPNGINYALGQVGQAFSFDGVSQHLIVSNVPFPAPGGEWSFETWFRSTAGGVILGQSAPTGGYIPMLYINAEGRLHAEAYNSGSTVSQMQSTTRVDDGFYHHAVITYANGQRRLYLDGTLVDSRNVPGVPYAPAYEYQIGSGIITGWPLAPANRFFPGQIDEPQFYHRALDPSEARRGYTAGKLGRSAIVLDNTLTDITAATGPYAGQITATGGTGPYTFAVTEGRLPVGLSLSPQGQLTGAVTHSSGTFDFAIEATSSSGAKSIRDYQIVVQPNARYRPAGVKAWWSANGNANDWSGNHPASAFSNVAGQPYAYGEGVAGQGFAFRGLGMMNHPFGLPFPNEGVVLPNSAFPDPGQRGPFSLELWFRATRPGGLLGQSNQPILGNYSLPMLYIDTAGYLRTQIGWTAAPNQVVSPGIVLDNTWHHLASTLDAAGLMQVYLDGTLIGTRSGIGPVLENPRVAFFLGHVSANGWPLSGDSFTGVTFTGQIDEVSTWSRVLTQEEILRLLACGPNGKANLTITPGGHLPAAVRHVAFTQALTVSGQTNPRFTLVSGSLPPGISLSTSGSVNPPVSGLFGTPSSTGYREFLLRNIPPAGPPATTELVDEHFTFNADPSAAYREWANAEGGLQGPARQPLASPFADSANLLKFGFNLHPTISDQRILAGENAGLPSVTRDPAGRLVIEFIRRRAITPPHLSYEITTGSDLDTLTPLSLNNALITPIDATWERVLVTDPILTPRRFGRVLVNQN